ncbi:uncharacterized protein LOC131669736 [Phymastichus coffea]|uniref:uncharacterized protein LOC131669736 n=1 Tax=Phymastichus coffea TaxID=108790 RepID=UPI00273B8418|nr:uncharacterized protein LOC131669736 [Phymastichus coffea]
MSKIVALDDVKQGWWDKLKDPVPEQLQCKKAQCSFAPEGHKKHGVVERSYALAETRLIIQYLVHYQMINYSKGMSVWEKMNSRGYLTHRTPQSLNNHFRRTILPNIRSYKLPDELESKFLELRAAR